MCNVLVVLQVCCLSFPTLCLTFNFSKYFSWPNSFPLFAARAFFRAVIVLLCTFHGVNALHNMDLLCCLSATLMLPTPCATIALPYLKNKEYYCIQNLQARTHVIMIDPIIPSGCCDPSQCPGQHSDCELDLEGSCRWIAECCILV